jgi:hypothetical protein
MADVVLTLEDRATVLIPMCTAMGSSPAGGT